MTARRAALALLAAACAAAMPAFAGGGGSARRQLAQADVPAPAVPDAAAVDAMSAAFARVPSPQYVLGAVGDAAPPPGTPTPAVPGTPSLAAAIGGPSAAHLVGSYVAPRLERLWHAALTLQNGVLRACGAGTAEAGRFVEEALDETVLAAAAAVGVGTIRPDLADIALDVLVPVADTEASRTRFDAISRGSLPAPQTLTDLALEHPGLAGLPAVEQLLQRIAVASTRERCALALAAAANVRLTAQRREAAFRTGRVGPAWDPAAAPTPLAGRQRLRDLVEALLLALDRMDRDLARFAQNPRSNRSLPFLSAARMQLFLAAEADALIDHLALIRAAPGAGPEALAVTAEIEAGLVKARDTLRRAGQAGRSRRATALAAFELAQAAAIARLPEAFGFDPTALRRPLSAYEARTPTD